MKKMASLHTGSNNELIYIHTDKVSISIKGKASHPMFGNGSYKDKEAELKILCNEAYSVDLRGGAESASSFTINSAGKHFGSYIIAPVFYEQQNYELIIEARENCQVEFWHENYNIRSKITRVGR